MDLRRALNHVLDNHRKWVEQFGDLPNHPSTQLSDAELEAALDTLSARLGINYPYFHPRYAGQMQKPPHPAAVAGYVAAMLINPNNHALDGGPATAKMEREVVKQLATMFGYGEHLGHLTSSGTIANLEALFVARELHPDKGVAFSVDSHYTHGRMCGVLGVEGTKIQVDNSGRMDIEDLENVLKTGKIGTVVATAGTTGLGAIDPIHEILEIARKYGVRVHVDAAYGGFFTLVEDLDPKPWQAIKDCDSIVVDPHKHGLQPYGCGAVLFRDPKVGRFYAHDSPYTYFTSDDLHPGEISLECSRSGASAAALWLTFQLIPPTVDGLGAVLAAGRRAAVQWADMIDASAELTLYQRPELDIVTYFGTAQTMSEIDATSQRVLHAGMSAEVEPVFLSVLSVGREDFGRRHPQITADADRARVLRSVLMKPESELYLDTLHARVIELVR
ncbi:aminotransferase class V-fold PLP-dependent enzyme [Kibdelosporangium philippinense]|uniref:Aminotransferase class V-fold PLP-dependent enzyme n=1 Tax=Kibdelosporangium philippinense TaxID=211113 RepID=A0ABS8ZSU7_9PSEU|nr:aminotransferase class V-fold PLP-dependent enzyme [Kibdelosporangium philippinense]MCE7010776.1 aminotransferase class V-fold PLP-dependent enzyme [Kibdelosporangium philippinense]